MKNNKKTITASEVNKYMYCPYQWYYERHYGRKELLEKRKKKLKNSNAKNELESKLKKGIKFHNEYYGKDKLKKRIKLILFIVLLLISMLIYYYFTVYSIAL